MGFEEELFHELATSTWDKRSRMQQEMAKGAKGEPFAVQELYRKGPLTPSQLAASMKTTTGRVSALLSALEKKGRSRANPTLTIAVWCTWTLPKPAGSAPNVSAKACARRSAGSSRKWGSAARANSLSLPRNSPRTCRCACPASRVRPQRKSPRHSQKTHRKLHNTSHCKKFTV